MDWVMDREKKIDVFLFVDADAFPLNALALHESFQKAAGGYLFGNAQVSTHIDPNRLFVAPSWCSISKNAWNAASCPSACTDSNHDVAQRWTESLAAAGVKIETLMPKKCIKPLWKMPNGADFGIGTTFESAAGAQTFHMFGTGGSTYDDPQYPAEVRLKLLEEQAAQVCAGPKS
jgi:hypothetical protein